MVTGWISSCNAQGQVNLAPYSFFGVFSANPKIIAFSSESYKDTIRNIEETGEFTWNLTSRGCKKFCVNGQLAGNCCTPMEMQINDRNERTNRQPAG
jgi:flavin reductase (DIM6/NTAB) family NADH-FMN oxidoreductase RutF